MDIKRNYSMTEHEALGMIYSVNKFRHYLVGCKFTFHVDHPTLLYLVSKQSLTWKPTEHTMTDYLSRIENDENAIEGDDDFPDNRILRFSASGVETDKS